MYIVCQEMLWPEFLRDIYLLVQQLREAESCLSDVDDKLSAAQRSILTLSVIPRDDESRIETEVPAIFTLLSLAQTVLMPLLHANLGIVGPVRTRYSLHPKAPIGERLGAWDALMHRAGAAKERYLQIAGRLRSLCESVGSVFPDEMRALLSIEEQMEKMAKVDGPDAVSSPVTDGSQAAGRKPQAVAFGSQSESVKIPVPMRATVLPRSCGTPDWIVSFGSSQKDVLGRRANSVRTLLTELVLNMAEYGEGGVVTLTFEPNTRGGIHKLTIVCEDNGVGFAVCSRAIPHRHFNYLEVLFDSPENEVEITKRVKVSEIRAVGGNSFKHLGINAIAILSGKCFAT